MSVIKPDELIVTLSKGRENEKRGVLYDLFNTDDISEWGVAAAIAVESTLLKTAIEENETIGIKHLALLCLEKVVRVFGTAIEQTTITPYVELADSAIANGVHLEKDLVKRLSPALERFGEFDALLELAWERSATSVFYRSLCSVIDAYLSNTDWLPQYLAERIVEILLTENDQSIAFNDLLALLKRHIESNRKIDAAELKITLDRNQKDRAGINQDAFDKINAVIEQGMLMGKPVPKMKIGRKTGGSPGTKQPRRVIGE